VPNLFRQEDSNRDRALSASFLLRLHLPVDQSERDMSTLSHTMLQDHEPGAAGEGGARRFAGAADEDDALGARR